jgi:hypothetical protein
MFTPTLSSRNYIQHLPTVDIIDINMTQLILQDANSNSTSTVILVYLKVYPKVPNHTTRTENGKLPATRHCSITVSTVSLLSFAAINLCTVSQWAFTDVSV